MTDQEIASCVETLLTEPGGIASSVNVNDVVRRLEEKLGLDLAHKAGFIRDQINLLLRPGFSRDINHGFYGLNHGLNHNHSHNHPGIQNQQVYGQFNPVSVPSQQVFQQQSPVAEVVKQERVVKAKESGKGSKASATTGVKRRGGPGGLNKVCAVSPELQVIVGGSTMSRTEIVKQLWAYIRKNNLQDPTNKRKIICNDELRVVFETDATDMFKMNKLLAKHITTLASSNEPEPDAKKAKTSDSPISTEPEGEAPPVLISDELAKFFGTGNKEMFQSEALSRIWDYIKVYQLKDPVNPKMIRCDAKLQQLFGCENLSALGVSEMLGRHLFKQS